MVLLYPELHTEIHLETHTVVINGNQQKVRPKTFELLKTLIAADGELVSKDDLLNRVWADVVVDEQVIFQSIKELRKLFPGQTVIKTVPRKGYAWLPKAGTDVIKSTSKVADRHKHKSYVYTLIAVIALALLAVFIRHKHESDANSVSGSVVILPVRSDIPTNDYNWVRYGVMDQVISRLQSTAQAGVLQTDYVMDVMDRANVSIEDIHSGRIESIFEVSGAELLIAMRVTGNPKDYQILYTLYQKNGIEKGVVLDDSIPKAADQIARLIGTRISPDFVLSQNAYVPSFTDRLMAEALEIKYSGDSQGALEMLEAVLVTAPDNLLAARLLVQTLVESGAPRKEVEKIAKPALSLAKTSNSVINQIRLGFWLAVSLSLNGDETAGEVLFDETQNLATSVNDWLYLAYIEEIRGQLRQSKQDFSGANDHFQQAMAYHRILHCPLGESNTLMHLSRLAYAQENQPLAMERAQQALHLIESRKLSTKLNEAENWLAHLSTKPAD